jgi:hypothetical protein
MGLKRKRGTLDCDGDPKNHGNSEQKRKDHARALAWDIY